MPDANAILDRLLRAMVWLLPGLLALVAIILVLSYVDRRPKRNQQPDDDKRADKP